MTIDIWEKAAKILVDDEAKNADIKQQTARAVVRALAKDSAKPQAEVLARLILDLQEFSPGPAYDIPETNRFASAIVIASEYYDRADTYEAALVVAQLNDIEKLSDFPDNIRGMNRFACIIPTRPDEAMAALIASGRQLPLADGTEATPPPVQVAAAERPAFKPDFGG